MKKITSSLFIATSVLGIGMSIATPTVFAAESANANSVVSANVASGGLTVSATDVSVGTHKIGDNIPNVDGSVTVNDKTGGTGWSLSVKSENFEAIEKAFTFGVLLEGGADVNITGTDSKVIEKGNQYAPQTFKATYKTGWGSTPIAKEYINQLVWTVTPNPVPPS